MGTKILADCHRPRGRQKTEAGSQPRRNRHGSAAGQYLLQTSPPEVNAVNRWIHSSFTVFGVRIGIRANRPGLISMLMSRVPVRWTQINPPQVDRMYSVLSFRPAGVTKRLPTLNFLFADAHQLASTAEREELGDVFESDIASYFGRTARNWLFVHAGVVGWNGSAIVIPGRSYSGKTTLVHALLKQGATYYSDEFAVLDENGCVHPYPRRLSIRANTVSERIAAAQLGAQTGSVPLRIGLVILTRYKTGAQWQPYRLTPGRAVLGLLENTLSARRNPELALHVLGDAIHRASVLEGFRGDAVETARAILREMDVKHVASGH